MRTWIERVSLRENFAGREGNSLDRLKAMRSEWDLTVLTVSGADYVLVLGVPYITVTASPRRPDTKPPDGDSSSEGREPAEKHSPGNGEAPRPGPAKPPARSARPAPPTTFPVPTGFPLSPSPAREPPSSS